MDYIKDTTIQVPVKDNTRINQIIMSLDVTN